MTPPPNYPSQLLCGSNRYAHFDEILPVNAFHIFVVDQILHQYVVAIVAQLGVLAEPSDERGLDRSATARFSSIASVWRSLGLEADAVLEPAFSLPRVESRQVWILLH